jgi:hypothetical protein
MRAAVRIFALLARRAPVAVVFRRGPSRQVLVVRWDTSRDLFYPGQWFKGRIYERRADLSPSGERLAYFAAKHHGSPPTWTAISRPPFLTALALWPKGDSWGGGALFKTEETILLNHPPTEMALAPGFEPRRALKVLALGAHAGRGEDDPIGAMRRIRDGWKPVQEGVEKRGSRAQTRIEFDPPMIWSKARVPSARPVDLLEIVDGLHERNGPWYITRHVVRDRRSGAELQLGRTDWADWDRGDLLFAREGRIFRLGVGGTPDPSDWPPAQELIDLSACQFEARSAPAEARTWQEPVPLQSLDHAPAKTRRDDV